MSNLKFDHLERPGIMITIEIEIGLCGIICLSSSPWRSEEEMDEKTSRLEH